MSGELYAELPNVNDEPYLVWKFSYVKKIWENGGRLGLIILILELSENKK